MPASHRCDETKQRSVNCRRLSLQLPVSEDADHRRRPDSRPRPNEVSSRGRAAVFCIVALLRLCKSLVVHSVTTQNQVIHWDSAVRYYADGVLRKAWCNGLASVRLSVCLSRRRTQRDSPEGSMRRGRCTFPSDYQEDGLTCSNALTYIRETVRCVAQTGRSSVCDLQTFPVLRSTCS